MKSYCTHQTEILGGAARATAVVNRAEAISGGVAGSLNHFASVPQRKLFL